MRLEDVLELPSLTGVTVVKGVERLDHSIRWVHVIDNPDAANWARPGQMVLTTGYAWPDTPEDQLLLFADLAAAGAVAVGLAVPHYYDQIPPIIVDNADALGLVLLEIPWEVPFARITEEVHTALLGEQMRLIERSEAIHRTLTKAAAMAVPLDALAATLSAETGHEVAIVGMRGDVLASTTSSESIDRFVNAEGSERKLGLGVNVGESGTVLYKPFGGFTWALRADVLVQGHRVAAVLLLGSAAQPGDIDARAAEHAALVTSLRIAHQRELGTIESRLRRSFVDDLLEGRVDADVLAAERAQAAGFSPRSNYRVAMAELGLVLPLQREGFARREAVSERVRSELQRSGVPDLLTTLSNRLVALLPPEFDAADLWSMLQDPDARLIVSRAHTGISGIQIGFEEARVSLQHVKPGQHATYDDLVLPRAMQGDVEAQNALVDRFAKPLRQTRSGPVLLDTLFVLARNDFVLVAAAHELGIHISTLRHRLDRMQELLKIDLRDTDVRFEVRAAGYFRELEP